MSKQCEGSCDDVTLPCLSVREPFVELFARKLKRFEVRGRAILKRYRNQYVMMHVSRRPAS